jgi:hypothetical protein
MMFYLENNVFVECDWMSFIQLCERINIDNLTIKMT